MDKAACPVPRGNWRFPRRDRGYGHWVATRHRVANPQWTVGINRIMGHRIGWFVVLGNWSYGICKPESLTTQRDRAVEKLVGSGQDNTEGPS